MFSRRYVTRREFDHELAELNERLTRMSTQFDDLNAAIDQVSGDLTTATTELQAELNALAAANPGIDLSPAIAKVQALDTAVQAVGTLKPDTPAPTA